MSHSTTGLSARLAGLVLLLALPSVVFAYCGNCGGNGACCPCPNGQAQCLYGHASCEEACGLTSSSGGAAGGGLTPQQQFIQQGVAIGATALGQELHKAIFGDPAAEAQRRAVEAARAAEQRRRDEEAQRQAEESKKRLLGESKSSDPNSLSLMGVEPAPELHLMTGSEALVNPPPSSTPNGNEEFLATHRQRPHTEYADSHNQKAPSGPGANQNPPPPPKHPPPPPSPPPSPPPAAYKLGFDDASQCYSQNAGPRCSGATAEQMQACVADYRRGYQVGDRQRVEAMEEANRVGQQAGASGRTNDAASDPRALGPCRTQWIESYNRGYFQGTQARAGR